MNKIETNNYVKSHGVLLPNEQVFLGKPLKVFKKVKTYSNYNLPSFNVKSHHSFQKRDEQQLKKHLDKAIYRGNIAWAVANLIIPAGSIVNLAQNNAGKLRANKAFCWSIVRLDDNKEVLCAGPKFHYDGFYLAARPFSTNMKTVMDMLESYDNTYGTYKNFEVLPDNFSLSTLECAGGIHFFVEAKKAVKY